MSELSEFIGQLKRLIQHHEPVDEGRSPLDYARIPRVSIPLSVYEEWKHLPKDEIEGQRAILAYLVERAGWPKFVSSVDRGDIYFHCGPVKSMPGNPNGHCHTSGCLSWLDIIEALIEARREENRIPDMLKPKSI